MKPRSLNCCAPEQFRFTRTLSLLSLTALLLVSSASVWARDMGEFFNQNCANCHGRELQGGSAPTLLTNVWKHGSDDASITRSITEGYPTNGMPAWKGTLSDGEIRAMVVLIHEKQAAAKRKGTVFPKPNEDEVVKSQEESFRIKTVVDDLDTPWSLAFLPDNRMLVTELSGKLRVIENGKALRPVADIPRVRSQGQGGLMAVALHPGYATNGWIYLSFTDRSQNGDAMTEVVRGHLAENRWTDQEIIFRAPENLYRSGGIQYGCRLVFDHQGHLFFTIGDCGHKEDAQDITRPNGKVHRVMDDGKIPQDNPFVNTSNAVPSIWSYGHRNQQGLAQNPVTGELWATEHGPRGGDELNLIQPGLNYGWPAITYGMDYNGSFISAFTEKEGMEQPITYWTPSIAVSAITFYTGDQFPHWKNNLFVSSLAAQELRRLVLDNHKVESQEILFKNIGRIRDVVTGPDGFLYVVLNNPGKIVRLEPAKE